MKITILDLWNEFKSSTKHILLAFTMVTVGCLVYSAYFITTIYSTRIEIELPAKIDIHSANTIATILRGGTFLKQEKEDAKIIHSVILSPSGDIINIDFSGADYAKVDAFKEKFVAQGLLKTKAYVAEVYGQSKATQVGIIQDDKNYNGETHQVKTISIYASILLGIVAAFCVLVVKAGWERGNV
jgi:hypothetical protein